MGCWDCYCLICGGPIVNGFKYKYIIDEYFDDNIKNDIKSKKKYFNWLNKLTLLRIDDNVINLKSKFNYDSYGSLVKYAELNTIEYEELNIIEYNITPMNWSEDDINCGIVCHTDCYNFICILFNTKIKYSHIQDLHNDFGLLDENNYKEPVSNFVGIQEYDFKQVYDNMDYYISPFKSEINGKRIIDIWINLLQVHTP